MDASARALACFSEGWQHFPNIVLNIEPLSAAHTAVLAGSADRKDESIAEVGQSEVAAIVI